MKFACNCVFLYPVVTKICLWANYNYRSSDDLHIKDL